MIFEECFHPNLQSGSIEDKEWLLYDYAAHRLWIYVDGELAGETYGCVVHDMLKEDDNVEGIELLNIDYLDTIYIFSTAILPKFRGTGLSKILKAYSLGMLSRDYTTVIGHARQGVSIKLSTDFGARIVKQFDDWYDTGEPYFLYQLDL